ncbi:MAG: C1 family peptidase [Spirochaetia bacterium]|nr:C1 family peptidase [Spirochaetia bacterium]
MNMSVSAFKKMLGYRKDRRDDRDRLMRAYLPAVKIPKKIDYTDSMSPVRDQQDEGTCVGFAATVGMKEYQENLVQGPGSKVQKAGKAFQGAKKSRTLDHATGTMDQVAGKVLSPRFLYNECKKLDGYPDQEGTEIRVAMKVLKNLGVCQEKYWRYEPHDGNGPDAPSRVILADAKKNVVKSYARILDLDELKSSLAQKGPCVIGVMVYRGMMKTTTGKVPMPKKGEKTLGGHAICPVGYDDAAKLVKFKNSWSEGWGTKGYGWLPYAYVAKYMMDAWSSVDVADPSPLTVEKVLGLIKR